jgi:hypothetical protein
MRDTASVMSMTQIVIGAALGYIVARAALFGTRHSLAWLQRSGVQMRLRALASLPGPTVAAGLIKYGSVIGASAALIALGAWAIGDYYAARSASNVATASVADPPMPAPASSPQKQKAEAEVAIQTPPRQALASAAVAGPDPYEDPAYKVQQPVRHGGAPPSLTERLLQRSEARARAELRAETQQHAQRSQYDCEAAERAEKYLKAGLDVWGFATWQDKYFPVGTYKGATLPACREITNVVEPAALDLQSTVAQGHHP